MELDGKNTVRPNHQSSDKHSGNLGLMALEESSEGTSTEYIPGDDGMIENLEELGEEIQISPIWSNSYDTTETATIDNEKPSLVPNDSRFNTVDFVLQSLNGALNSIEYDKALVIQSKMAGNLNSTTNDVLRKIERLQEALEEHIVKYRRLKEVIIPQIDRNLQEATKITKRLTRHVKEIYPVEYSKGRSKVLENLTEDEEGLFL
ncbi:hypothetical protein CAS74_001724 [Pichia kudriavzevii]|uniref:Biogenesis of lysosome-related organelles complex 1 subunit KXD1 n=1 Tax=Pichia kudriavzevii TaxID=4909 RepID=A0A1Z8JS54_PICKU|nr:uncharacterized protein C5L36_0A05230 [Pichia kudriavzevii]AWU73926.1 hypothetical protein C5L36_0A05230 [Pichia kudriavzevii]OUT23406.1 hypothetical protein CAS74_001724 [Pichia kudriavzevii]